MNVALCITVIGLVGTHSVTKTHNPQVGPMKNFLVGKKPGEPGHGIKFAFKVEKNGRVVTDSIDLQPPYWSSPLSVKLADAKFADGHLTGKVQVHNATGRPVVGLRFDAIGGAEEFKGEAGPVMIRPVALKLDGPWALGDLPNGASSPAQPFNVGGIQFSPDGRVMNVEVEISGLTFEGSILVPIKGATDVTTDGEGRVIVKSGATPYVADKDRVSNAPAMMPRLAQGSSVRKRPNHFGQQNVLTSGNLEILVSDGTGHFVRKIGLDGIKLKRTVALAFGPSGRLYVLGIDMQGATRLYKFDPF